MGSGRLSRRGAFLPRFPLPPVLPATGFRGRSLASLCFPLITESPAMPKQKQTTTVGQLFASPVTHFTSSSCSLSRATEVPSTVAEGFLHLRIQSPSSRSLRSFRSSFTSDSKATTHWVASRRGCRRGLYTLISASTLVIAPATILRLSDSHFAKDRYWIGGWIGGVTETNLHTQEPKPTAGSRRVTS